MKKSKRIIPVFRPSIGEEEVKAVAEVLRSRWIGLGPKTEEFEKKFANYVGAKYAVAVNSCTAALHLALKVMNVEGGEVITTPLTFVSTNHAILYNNAITVFADIEEDTLNIRVDEIEKKLSPKTKAILVVHYGGHPCDMDPILEIAKYKNIKVIEDAAHAIGAEYKGRKIGSIGDATCFSFHAIKNLSTGDGGMITIHMKKIEERLKIFYKLGINRNVGIYSKDKSYKWDHNIDTIGFKYYMNDIVASIGLVQLSKIEETNAKRKEFVKIYNEAFADLDWLKTPVEKDYAKSANHNYVIKVLNGKRDELISYLAEKGISAGVYYIPNHLYKIYKPYYKKLPIAESVWKKLVALPLFPDLKYNELFYVIENIRNFV